MSDIKNLYHDVILDHYKHPRNFYKLALANRQADGLNPLCGDKLSIYLHIENGVIQDIGFVGAGCAISIASASMMTEHLKGKTETEARSIFERFHQQLNERSDAASDAKALGNLTVFSGVREYPVRVKCATLAWQALRDALDREEGTVATE